MEENMNEYALLFRQSDEKPSPAQMQAAIKPWQEWLGSIAAQNKLLNKGIRLQGDGRMLRGNSSATDGPYSETKEIIGGLIIVKAADYDEAISLAQGCPILHDPWNGCVEIRQILSM